jgi:hypothetical protein
VQLYQAASYQFVKQGKEVQVLMRSIIPKALVAIATLACSCAMGVAPAQATAHGPFWSIAGKKLGKGESHEVLLASSSGVYSMSAELLGRTATVSCKKQAIESASITGGVPSTVKATFKLSECSQTGEGNEKCTVNEPITTEPLTGTLGYATKERTGKILARFEGTKVEGRSRLFKIKFTGASCVLHETEAVGALAAEVVSGGKAEEVGKEAKKAEIAELKFPATQIAAAWIENEAKEIKEEAATFNLFGNQGKIEGSSELKLSGGSKWGTSTGFLLLRGPLWSVSGNKLGKGESRELVAASTSGEYTITNAGYKITCKKEGIEKGSLIGGTPGTIAATFLLSECAVTGNGTGCKVPSPLVTRLLTGTLGYEDEEQEGKILIRFEGPEGGRFINFHFEGAGCLNKEAEISGALIAELVSKGKALEVGEEGTATANQLRFPATPIKSLWIENEAGTEVTEKTASMRGLLGTEEIAGSSELELSGLQVWGAET